jgi:predicted DNA-binding antitoxin AbrB/MazE fold protein
METFTIQAVYEKGVLKPKKKLNLPEHSLVTLKVKSTRSSNKKTEFASLIGMWENAPKDLDLERSLARARQRSKAKVKKLARALK